MNSENQQDVLPSMTTVHAPKKSIRHTLAVVLAAAALIVSGWQWLDTRHRIAEQALDFKHQHAEADTGRQQLQEQVEALQAALGQADARLEEFRSQGTALQSLYQDMARSREEAVLIEVEQAVTIAGQQLQLTGNVPVALLALQSADARLARLERPQYGALRKAVSKDIERLAALPVVDLPGISFRLEQVVLAADRLPLVSSGRPDAAPAGTPKAAAATQGAWQRVAGEVWQEIKGLIRIQRFDGEAPELLAPGQEFFLRENLKLRLLNARLALFARDQATFRNELKAANGWLSRHFVGEDKAVQAAQASLVQMAGLALNAELPTLADTQAALRAVRGVKDKR